MIFKLRNRTDSSIEQQENIINEAQSAKDKSLSDISLLQSKIDGIRVEKNKTEQKISEIKIGVYPAGSGNDVARNIEDSSLKKLKQNIINH